MTDIEQATVLRSYYWKYKSAMMDVCVTVTFSGVDMYVRGRFSYQCLIENIKPGRCLTDSLQVKTPPLISGPPGINNAPLTVHSPGVIRGVLSIYCTVSQTYCWIFPIPLWPRCHK